MFDDQLYRWLDTLAVVAETGSFAAAARTLGVTRAAVSRRIADLEESLGARLLHRTTRKTALTEVGRQVVARARRMRAEAEEALTITRGESDAPTGLLRVTAPVGLGQRFVAPALAAFVERHPKLNAELLLDDRALDLVEGSIDLAIRGGRLADSSLRARKIGPLRLLLCASPRYLRVFGEPKAPADLLNHAWIVMTPMGRPQKVVLEAAGRRTTVRLDGRLAASDGEVVRQWAAAGLGIALLPKFWIEDDLTEGRLRRVLPRHRVRGGAIYAVHPYQTNVPAKVHQFIDALRQLTAAE